MDEPVHFVLMVKPCVNTRPVERKMYSIEWSLDNELEFGFSYDGYPKSRQE